ncbi:RNA polymerase sigma factor [Mucilaginibacter sp. KACC 22063]|uniref:RNA polymerase sigma factor n=1 Tax=Mucilaginibacter sp. KACC 22063 TaxID=3025666 RepID=UPI0023672F0B|nr:RNA polymerase sigma factor [Mucilaginibacter sp. KACC 22063]WDF56334.1 RNA polymerase sigma factor [Mucilaginibacter sp. KACC 22063]
MISENSLNRIWEGCKNNDRKQQELLYRVLAPKMLAVCMRYTADRDEAQDVLQEGFIKIFKNIHNYRGEGSLEGWMRRIMTHSAISRYRKLRPMMLTAEISENCVPFYSAGQTNNRLETQELLSMIQQLPGNYRSVFNLYAIEGYSHQEIGSMLGITELLSRTTLHRARGILKKKVIQRDPSYAA